MEVAGLVVSAWALPEATMSIAKLAKEIANRIRVYRNASSILQELYEVGYSYHDSILGKNVELAAILVSRTDDERLQQAAQIQIRQLYQELEKAKEVINQLISADGKLNRWRFAFEGERALKRILKNLVGYQQEFVSFITMLESTLRNLPQPQDCLLPRSSLRYLSSSWEDGIFQHSRPHLRLCAAEWKEKGDDGIQQINVLIEEQPINSNAEREDVERNTQELARLLFAKFPSGGVLQCLGYRSNTSSLDLVFRVPDGLAFPRSLQEMIWEDQTSGVQVSLNHRLRLAQMLAQAVLSVHAAGLVHKNIRPETILHFQNQDLAQTQGKENSSSPPFIGGESHDQWVPILTEWRMLRKIDDTSSRRGEDDWHKNLYRHPERQGLRPEARYSMIHDIYSLGVCLLEIGLWQPLVVRHGAETDQKTEMAAATNNTLLDLSPLFRQAAQVLDVSLASSKGNAAFRSLIKPVFVREVLLHLAVHSLPSWMGDNYTKIIVDCLTCLDNAEQMDVFKGDKVGAEIGFHRMVLQPLLDINM